MYMCKPLFSAEPSAPRGVKMSDVSRSGLTLSWQAPSDDGGAPIKGYYVEKRSGYSHKWSRVNRKPIRDTVCDITDLHEGEEYEFRVLAVNEAGTGEGSDYTPTITIKDPFCEYIIDLYTSIH